MSPLTLKKSRASKGSVSKVSLDRRRQERMCSGDALATPHFAHTGKTLLPWLKEQLLRLHAQIGRNEVSNLTLLDFFIWEYIKNTMYGKETTDISHLKRRTIAAIETSITPEILHSDDDGGRLTPVWTSVE
ncbi:hypothetical protein AVEN_174735-1 [Araneus ventricosus]|uniref:Uncharacterized protein n=1 Tax=Araneus ventricosus TaxID=182803 RepID=A0A4Y2BJS0_ARAVE|nr:hypothetical protein AVEN_174735-1 [Araneus ventricosus]